MRPPRRVQLASANEGQKPKIERFTVRELLALGDTYQRRLPPSLSPIVRKFLSLIALGRTGR